MLFCDNYTRAKEYIDQVEELPTLKHIILLKTDKITNVPNGPIEGKKINVSANYLKGERQTKSFESKIVVGKIDYFTFPS